MCPARRLVATSRTRPRIARSRLSLSHLAPSSRRHQVDAPPWSVDRVHAHGYRIAKPHRPAAAPADERGLGLVEVESLPAQQPRRQQPLVHIAELAAEAHERPRADHAGDLALELRFHPDSNSSRPSRNEAQTRSASRSIAVASRSRSELRQPASLTASRLRLGLPGPDRRQQRPMGDEVRVATDRGGEVGVGGAAKPGMAEVSVRVVGLLQRPEHKRCIRVAAMTSPLRLARHQAAHLAGQLAGLGSGQALGQRGRRHVEGGQLLDEQLDPLRLRLLVDPIQGGDAAPLQQLGDALVGEDHQVLDQPVGLGLGHRPGAGDGAVGIEAELGLERLDLQ